MSDVIYEVHKAYLVARRNHGDKDLAVTIGQNVWDEVRASREALEGIIQYPMEASDDYKLIGCPVTYAANADAPPVFALDKARGKQSRSAFVKAAVMKEIEE